MLDCSLCMCVWCRVIFLLRFNRVLCFLLLLKALCGSAEDEALTIGLSLGICVFKAHLSCGRRDCGEPLLRDDCLC